MHADFRSLSVFSLFLCSPFPRPRNASAAAVTDNKDLPLPGRPRAPLAGLRRLRTLPR